MLNARPRKLVVAGLIVGDGWAGGLEHTDHVLVSQRRADQSLPLQWEFPGGKVEPGESPTDALARELLEELGVKVQVGKIWDVLFHPYPDFDLVMLVYRCVIEPGQEPHAVEVAAVAWCEPAGLSHFDILPADLPLVARLRAEGIPPA